ncbi:MAG: hypothetical protein IT244_01800, partial [Bacteroidia bacterium]|nr:hypothetical protein [Bacteroidia bacterium]
MVDWASTQSWIQSLYLFLITAGAFALFTGMDLLNRVDVYKVYKQSNEQETFWSTDFAKNR